MASIVVLGLGNWLLRDEGFGVHVVKQLEKLDLPGVELVDGGTSGIALLRFVEAATHLIIVDAINAGLLPGKLLKLNGEELARSIPQKFSQHQLSFHEILSLAYFRGQTPEEIVVIGIQPHSIEWGCELTPIVRSKVKSAVKMVCEQLGTWQANYLAKV
ncbi:MAG TPA: HyaD/HybD family hydrogenase maturation endopeptidase [Verrucomicrobiae bacterium]|nr:HyaD/HybD family hydrogenase maturation endopeptidase [Verrucomicrobiae bacterium]